MYTLTLDHTDRLAITWVGHRYGHGDALYTLLWLSDDVGKQCPYPEIENAEWDDGVPIEFTLPEYRAWEVKAIVDEDPEMTCFAPGLRKKFLEFCDKIV